MKVAFSHSQNGHFRCPKRKSETCSDIRSVTWLRGKKFAHFRPLESGFLDFSVTWLVIWLWKLKFSIFVCLFVCTSRFANFAKGKWSNNDFKNCFEIKAVTTF